MSICGWPAKRWQKARDESPPMTRWKLQGESSGIAQDGSESPIHREFGHRELQSTWAVFFYDRGELRVMNAYQLTPADLTELWEAIREGA